MRDTFLMSSTKAGTMKLSSVLFVFSIASLASLVLQAHGVDNELNSNPPSPFSNALLTLQQNIGYNFNSVDLLRRAMTHSSYSRENNRALSILGLHVIETSVSLRYLERNIDVSAKDLNFRISEIAEVDTCAAEGLRLGLDKVVRVSGKINSTIPAVVCGACRAIFGAVAVDTSKADDAAEVFWSVWRSGGARVSAV